MKMDRPIEARRADIVELKKNLSTNELACSKISRWKSKKAVKIPGSCQRAEKDVKHEDDGNTICSFYL